MFPQLFFQHGSGVFTMTFSSADVAYLSLCYMEWPSFTGSFLHSACLFHPYPYNFTIRPGTPTKIGRPLRNLQSDHITVSINVTDNSGGHRDSILERFIVDGSLPGRTITTGTNFLTIEFVVTCDDNFFGPRCSRFCKVAPEKNDHFLCSRTDRLDESETASGVISRLVSRKRAYHDAVLLMEQRSGKYSFVISGAVFFVILLGCALYMLNFRRTATLPFLIACVLRL
ncbi:hypothetical protein Q1695_002869 [Nippostrongylus brasiliensis]|nr:hypothetical protein Q1695_002869 [Nippostrongylus brasiliensis]